MKQNKGVRTPTFNILKIRTTLLVIQSHVPLWSSDLMRLSCHPTSRLSLVIQPHVLLLPSNLMCLSGHPTACASRAIQPHVFLLPSSFSGFVKRLIYFIHLKLLRLVQFLTAKKETCNLLRGVHPL